MARRFLSNLSRARFSRIKESRTTRLWFFLAVTVSLLTVLFLTVDLAPKVEGEFFFSSDDAGFQYEKMIAKIFPARQEQIILSVKGDVRSDDYLDRIRILTEVLDVIPEVSGVKSLSSGPKNYYDALKSPLWARIILSDDGESSNVIAILQKDSPPEEVIPKIESAISLFEAPDFRIKIAGVPYVVEVIRRNLLHDLKFFSTAAFIIFGIVIMLIFRSPKILLGTIISCVNACVLTLIITNLLGVKTGILTVNLSTIIFVLTLSHIVFLTHNWRRVAMDNCIPGGSDYTKEALKMTFVASFWCMTGG